MDIYLAFPALSSRPTSLLAVNRACAFLYSTNEFKDYRHRTNSAKDETGEVYGDSHSILHGWKNNFCHLLKVHGVNDVRQTEK
jgi:hypothetical protein